MIPEEQFENLCRLIGVGMTVNDACEAMEISKPSFYRWMKLYPDRAEKVAAARAKLKQRLLLIVNKGMAKDVKWAAWMLERKYPEEYGARVKTEGVLLGVGVDDLTDEQKAEVQRQFSAMFGVGQPVEGEGEGDDA